jgi:two-component system sensor histidine kinase KdpD
MTAEPGSGAGGRGTVLVCVRPHAGSTRLVRATRRMAESFGAPWVVAYVESPTQPPLSARERADLDATLRLAEELGGRTVVLGGTRVAQVLLAYAREQGVTRIVVGKPAHGRWRDRLRGSLLDDIVRASHDIDVYAISGEDDEEAPRRLAPASPSTAGDYGWAALAVLACSAVATLLFHGRFDKANLIMVYLAGVATVATRIGPRPALFASVLSVFVFNLFFVPPHGRLSGTESEYLVTLAVMMAVAILISTLAARVRQHADAALAREVRTRALYATSRELAALTVPGDIAEAGARRIGELAHGEAAVLLADGDGLKATDEKGRALLEEPGEKAAAERAVARAQPLGRGTEDMPGAAHVFVPLLGSPAPLGVVAVRTSVLELGLLETAARLVAGPLERARLTRAAEDARLQAERERLRGTLLRSVSHDLRTPLAAITGASSTLLTGAPMSDGARAELQRTILEESQRLDRLIGNLLEMTRLESGEIDLRRDWHSLEELVGGALARLDHLLAGHRVETCLDPRLPLVHVDAVLVEQLVQNLLENAAKYTPRGSTIRVAARAAGDEVEIEVRDDGPGLPPGSEERVFDKFHRERTAGRSGFGLGLAICRAIVAAHGGRIAARNLAPHGVSFVAALPVPAAGPAPPPEADA